MIIRNHTTVRMAASLMLAAALVLTSTPVAVAAEGDLHLQRIHPESAQVVFGGATGMALVPGGAATPLRTVYVADPAFKTVTGIRADGTLVGPWSGTGGEAFVEPTDVASDQSGNLYVADKGRPYIYKIDAETGALIEKIGAGLVDPVGVDWLYVAGGGHQVFVADANGRIVRFSAAGDTGAGVAYTGGGTLVEPADVFVQTHTEGFRLWVTDRSANKVVCINWTQSVLASWGSSGELTAPVGVAVRSGDNGHVIVSDASGRVQRFTQGGTYQETLVAEGEDAGQVKAPQRISLDVANDWMWIAEKDAGRVQLFDGLGVSQRTVGKAAGDALGEFRAPTALAVGPGGRLAIADSGNHRVQVLGADGTALFAVGSEGSGTGQFMNPAGVAFDAGGNIYVSDTLNHRVQKFDSAGEHVATWGGFGSGPGQFDLPKGIAVDSAGYVYVADTGNYRVVKLAPNGTPVATIASYTYKSAQRFLFRLSDIAVGPDDHLFVYDGWNGPDGPGTHWLPEFGPDGSLVTVHLDYVGGGGPGARWAGLDIGDARTIYLAEGDAAFDPTLRMVAWRPGLTEGGYYERLAKGGGPGQWASFGDVAIGPFGTLYASDPTSHRVQRFGVEDTTPPFTNYTAPTPWVDGPTSGVTIYRPTDGLAGPLQTWVRVNGAAPYVVWSASEEATANPSRYVSVSDEGTNTIEFWAVDAFGNRENTRTVVASIDRRFPEATVTVAPSGWTTGSVGVSVAATDSGAGVAHVAYSTNGALVTPETTYTAPFSVGAEGVTGVRVTVRDGAGKSIIAGGQAKIDRTPPSTSLTRYLLGEDETAGYLLWASVTGAGSELETASTTYWRVDEQLPQLGSSIHVALPGTHTVEYWSVDAVGNTESADTTEVVVPSVPGGGGGEDPPEGGFLIAGGAAWQNTNELPITSSVTGAVQMRFMAPGDADWRAWVDYAEEVTLTADPAEPDGEWVVYAQYRNGTDESAQVADAQQTIGIDRIAPVTGSNANEDRTFVVGEEIILVPQDERSGVAEFWYRIDDEEPVEGSTAILLGEGQHRLRWWAVDEAGNSEDEHDRTLTFAKTVPTLTTTSKSSTVGYGATYYLKGTLAADGHALASKRVRLQYLSGSTWTDHSLEATTDAGGVYTFAVKVYSKTSYRARYVEDEKYGGALSSAVVVTPYASVGPPVAPSVMYVNRAKPVTVILKPRHKAGTSPVRIYKDRYVNGTWKGYGYVNARAYDYGSYTRCSASVKLPYRGRWRLRAYAPLDSGHVGTWASGPDYVTVK